MGPLVFAELPLPGTRKALVLLSAAFLAYKLARQIRENQSDAALAGLHGCQPAPELTRRWPLGFDRVKHMWDANADGRLLAFLCSSAKEYEPHMTVSQDLLFGLRAYHTLHTDNVEAVLSTNFKDYSFGSRAAAFALLSGTGIFIRKGHPCKHSHWLLRKPFARARHQSLEISFREHVDNLVGCMPDGGVVDLQRIWFAL